MGSEGKFTMNLYIAPPDIDCSGVKMSDAHKVWLREVENLVRRVVGSEAKLWLCSDIATVSVPSHVQGTLFMGLLREAVDRSQAIRASTHADVKDCADSVTKQVVRLLCDGRAEQVGKLLAHDDKLLHRFFSGHTKRVMGWFDNFARGGDLDHRLGSRALARFVFMHREDYWHALKWKGKHSQAPATVAAKPFYFSELDVLRTVDNFLENVPSFWRSEELQTSLENGEFLSLDSEFFHEELLWRLICSDSPQLWSVIEDYVKKESFSLLCHRFLHLMNDESLLKFLSRLSGFLKKARADVCSTRPESRLEFLSDEVGVRSQSSYPTFQFSHLAGVEWNHLSDASFSYACAGHWRKLLKLFGDEEHEDELRTLSALSADGFLRESEHWLLRWTCIKEEKWKALKWLSMEAFLLFYQCNQQGTSDECIERLLTEIGVEYLRKNCETSDLYNLVGTRKRRKKSEGRERRRRSRRTESTGCSDDEDSGFESSEDRRPSKLGSTSSWRLSVDRYSTAWTKTDVAEHLVSYALKQWFHWLTSRW